MKPDLVAENFSQNLRLACRYYPSISSVCRRIGMNRQQFNTYLSKGATPSISNFKRIADFFGVDESEMLLDSKEFAKIIEGKNRNSPYLDFLSAMTQQIIGDAERMRRQLSKYQGYYYCVLNSCGHPEHIIRSLVQIREKNGIYAVKTIEILVHRTPDRKKRATGFIFKRNGALLLNSGRLFIYDYEQSVNRTPSITILFPSNRSQAPLLKGVHLNVSGGTSQRPFAARVVYQNLGLAVNLREALGNCGLFHKTSSAISDDVKSLIQNDLEERSCVLGAFE
jgi:transcriptional regulator with XRE-family HTH domain